MVQHFDAVESVIFAEYLKTDRARGDECADTVFAEQFGIVIHHSAGRLNFPGKFQRTAATDAAVLVGPPYLFARSFEDLLHRAEYFRRKERHAPGKVTDLAFTLGTVEAFDVIVAVGGACDGVFSPAVQPEGAELDTDRAGYDAPSAKQAVVGYRIGQVSVATVAQEIDRLNVVDPGSALELARIDAYPAP